MLRSWCPPWQTCLRCAPDTDHFYFRTFDRDKCSVLHTRITYNKDILHGKIHHRLSPVLLDCSFLLHVDTNWSHIDSSRQAATPPGSSRRNGRRSTHPRQRRNNRVGLHARLKARATRPPLHSILLANFRSLENEMDELRTRITSQLVIRESCALIFTETWTTASLSDLAIQLQGHSVHHGDHTSAPVKTKVAVCVFTLTTDGVRMYKWLKNTVVQTLKC